MINDQAYFTSAELTAALKTLPRPDTISLVQEGVITPARHKEAIAAIQSAGLNVPIGFVGNEVFY